MDNQSCCFSIAPITPFHGRCNSFLRSVFRRKSEVQSPSATRRDLQQESFGANSNLVLLSASSLSIACEKSAQESERYDRQELTALHGPKVHDKLRGTDSPESSWLGLEADIDFRFECAMNGTLRGDLHEPGMLLRCYCTGQLHIELDPIEHFGLR